MEELYLEEADDKSTIDHTEVTAAAIIAADQANVIRVS